MYGDFEQLEHITLDIVAFSYQYSIPSNYQNCLMPDLSSNSLLIENGYACLFENKIE